MSIGYAMKQKVMAYQKERARNKQYQQAAAKQIKVKSEAAYYKAKEEQEIKLAQEKARQPGFAERLKQGLVKSVAKGRSRPSKAAYRKPALGLGGQGPQFGLTSSPGHIAVRSDAFSLGSGNKKKGSKGIWDL